jgi:glyoxalase family protein
MQNFRFYTQTLGLRLVKRTVNFDDPATYHFYYGDETGRPGSILTFFPWEHAAPGSDGVGLAHATTFRIPAASIDFWRGRLLEKGVKLEPPAKHFDEQILIFSDPDGMRLAYAGVAGAGEEPAWSDGDIPAEHAVRGLHGVTLLVNALSPTSEVLTDILGFKEDGREGKKVRYRANDSIGSIVELHQSRESGHARMGRGSVHHVAFRAADDGDQAEMARRLVADCGLHPTGQKDRQYFRSIYFHEPGGVLFEIATDEPGFTIDEPLADLGKSLKLPRFLEPRRRELEAVLPSLGPVA